MKRFKPGGVARIVKASHNFSSFNGMQCEIVEEDVTLPDGRRADYAIRIKIPRITVPIIMYTDDHALEPIFAETPKLGSWEELKRTVGWEPDKGE